MSDGRRKRTVLEAMLAVTGLLGCFTGERRRRVGEEETRRQGEEETAERVIDDVELQFGARLNRERIARAKELQQNRMKETAAQLTYCDQVGRRAKRRRRHGKGGTS